MPDNILVTGGAGFIGSHACKALAAAGFTPIVYDNLSQGHRWAVQWGPLVEGDLLDDGTLARALTDYRPLAVMHFAGKISVAESVANSELYHEQNVAASKSLLKAMQDKRIGKLVYSSTAAVYGEPTTVPIPETHPTQPTNPYGETKLAVEHLLREQSGASKLLSVSLRYFNAAGSDPDGDIGEAHDPETHLIPIVLEVAAGKRQSLKVFGNDYDTPDGTCIRDYVHVSDLADAHVLALRRLLDGLQNENAEAFNLGNGNGSSVLEIIEAARSVTGCGIPYEVHERREGDPARLVASNARALDVLGWRPRRPDIRDQISDAWQWISAQVS